LRAYDASGKLLWIKPALGDVWAVTVAANAKLVIAAYGDGTIRWHRLSDGQELLAFFPHVDHKRWVLWTPTGYYDAGPGGEELISWHLNRQPIQTADFFPAGKFRDRFYRPDIIDQMLTTLDEAQAVKMADAAKGVQSTPSPSFSQALPPIVELVSSTELNTAEPNVTIRYQVRTAADAPVLAVRSRIEGQVADQKGLKPVADTNGDQSLNLTIPARNCEIQLFAENRYGVSAPVTVRVSWTGAQADFVIKPKLYVLAIGVGAYQNADIPKLDLSVKDANDFAAIMKQQQGKLYRAVEVKILTDQQATRDNIVDDLDWLQKAVTQHDLGMIFLSGHGLNDTSLGYVYLPVNADTDKLRRTGVAMNDIKNVLPSLVGKAVFFWIPAIQGVF
jgi:hypothetical protein